MFQSPILSRWLKPAIFLLVLSFLTACTSTPQPAVTDPTQPADTQPIAATTESTSDTTAATAAPATDPTEETAPTEEPEPDSEEGALVGQLEGPTVITDPALFPTTFNEAPELAARVAAGELPPVDERIGSDPLVIEPVHEIGQYGGTWRRAFTGPGDGFNGFRCCSGRDTILYFDYTGQELVPNIAKDWELSEDGRITTIFLREGMRWSDGTPFTADDFLFWYEDMYLNEELVPTPTSVMTINSKPVELVMVDDYTVQFVSPDPYYLLPQVLAGQTLLGGQANRGAVAMGGYAPAHYLQQFHPDYVSQEELDEMAAAEGFDNWVALFKFKNNWTLNPELPVVSPWVTVSPINTDNWILERNPYSIWVDTAGNQLPYIDRVVMSLAENLEVLNLKAIAGELDMQSRHIDISKLPVLLENQETGNYRVHIDPASFGSDMFIKFNLSYQVDPEIAQWLNNVDFRRALALGIDREQINEIFWLGTGVPSSVVPADDNPLNPGPEYRTLWAVHDVELANNMLDEMGLTDKDSEGYRLRTDGGGRLRLEVMTLGGQFLPFTNIMEVIKEQWQEIGIDIVVQEVERSLAVQRSAANEHQMCVWTNDGSEDLWTAPNHVIPFDVSITCGGGPTYAQWFQSSGEEGVEPPDYLVEIYDDYRAAFGVPPEEAIALGQKIWASVADNVLAIGVVGLGPAAGGVRVSNADMGNVPARQLNSPAIGSPSISRPMTFYFKN